MSRAISRALSAIIIVVVIVVASTGVYFATQSTPASPTSSVAQLARDTLVIDDVYWPIGELNQLTSIGGAPFPNWGMYTVYQSLVTLNGSLLYRGGGTQVVPMLATDWSASSDGTVYTFNLRQNITFSNGDPFNAYQVWGQMYGLYYLSGNSSSFLNGYNMFDFSKTNFGPSTLALMTQSGLVNPTSDLIKIMSDSSWPIYVTSPHQLVFHLKSPFGWFDRVLVAFVGLIFDTQYVLQNGGFGTPTAVNTNFNLHPIPGTGPYLVSAVEEGSYAKFTQDSNYWGRSMSVAEIQANPYLDPGHVKTVIVYTKSDDIARYTDLESGVAQISGIQTQNWPLVLANPDKYAYFLMPDASMAFVAVGMNTHRYPTNITAFRQAVVHAVNLTDISDRVYFGQLAPMVGPEYPAQKDWYNLGNLPPYSYDLGLAKKYLAESGVDVAKLPPLEFRVTAGCTQCIATGQIIQSDLGQLGINIDILVTPSSQYALPYALGEGASYQAGLPVAQQAAQFSWLGGSTFAPNSPTPADAWVLFVSYNSPVGNGAEYGHPVVQQCVDAWTSTVDVSMIKDLCTKAQAQIYNDAPYIWLGGIKLAFGGGSVVWQKSVVKNMLLDPIFTGGSSTAIFNTVTFV